MLSSQLKRELAAIAQSKAVELTGYAAALAYGPQQNPGCAISIRTLCSSFGRTDAARDVIQTLGNYYALSQSVMHTTLPPGVSSADIMNDLRLQPREAACISCAELTALHNLYVQSSKTSGHM